MNDLDLDLDRDLTDGDYLERKLYSDHTLHSLQDGFFKDYLDHIDSQISHQFVNNFNNFKTDEERLTVIWSVKGLHDIPVRESYQKKNKKKSEFHRAEGNQAFQERNYQQALRHYSKAVIMAHPDDNQGHCLPLAYANRSAALYHMENYYKQCLLDIQQAIETGYPENFLYKVYDRKGQCLVKLCRYMEAKDAFDVCLEALSTSGLEGKKLQLLKKDLRQKLHFCSGKSDKELVETEAPSTSSSLYRGPNPALPSASSTVTIYQSEKQGRYAVVNDAVPTGQILMKDNPYATAMKKDKISHHCFSCFKSLLAAIPCLWCSDVSFCSIRCRDLSVATHHKWECSFLQFLKDSGMSLNCFLALRIITQHGLSYFKKIRPRLQNSTSGVPTKTCPHRSNDYLSIYHLAGLETMRPNKNFIPLAVMAALLLKVLQKANFFGDHGRKGTKSNLTEDEVFIGSLLLRNLQVVQFNAHEVSGMEFKSQDCNVLKSRSVFLGLGLYPTAAFCNHACYPSIARYFDGTKLVLVNLRPLHQGDALAENYGPIFTKHTLQDRQKKLLSTYWFKCTCEACLNNWPVYSQMIQTKSFCCQVCVSALPQRVKNQSHVACKECGKANDIIKIVNTLEEANKYYEKGKTNLEDGKAEEAITSFIKYVEMVYKKIALPSHEIFTAFDCLRTAFIARSTIQMINDS